MLRHELAVDRLTAAAVEQGSAARYARYRDDDGSNKSKEVAGLTVGLIGLGLMERRWRIN